MRATALTQPPSMRSIVFVASAVLFTETLMYAAMSPLLPSLSREFALTKAQAGVLVAAYPLGQVVAALPLVFFVARAGVRVSVVCGLAMLGLMSVAFGLASTYDLLVASRLLQGVAGALCWSSALGWLVESLPRARRGEVIGVAMGVSSAGLLLGPVFGGLAAFVGRDVAFAAIGVVGMPLAVAVAVRRDTAVTAERPSLTEITAAHATRDVLVGQGMLLLPGLLVGVLGVLGPLQLYRAGIGSSGIATTFLVAAATGVLLRPFVGRWSDRRGRVAPIRACLIFAAPLTFAMPFVGNRWILAAVVVVAFALYETLWGPAIAFLADCYERTGIQQGSGFALMNIASGVGMVVGAAAGGFAARMLGDRVVYSAVAAASVGVFVALRGAGRSKADPTGE